MNRQSIQELLSEVTVLREEMAELKREKHDLELLLELTTEYSDHVAVELKDEVEATKRESEERFQMIVEATPVPVFVTRVADGQIVYASPMAGPLFGVPTEHLLGRRVVEFYNNRTHLNSLLDLLTSTQHINNYEVELNQAEGTPIWCALSLRPLIFNNEPCLLSILHDITKRKQAEQVLADYNRTLEQQVARRTAELARAIDEAEEARAAAEVANEAKSAFLTNVSHELRTPLNAILGFTQLMTRSQSLKPEEQENLQIIHSSGERLLSLINKLLNYSKLEAGYSSLNEVNFDLYALLYDLEKMFRMKAAEKLLRLEFEWTADLPRYVRTDLIKTRQILIQLLSNAIKFTTEGGVSLRVRKEACQNELVDDITDHLYFEIEDSGVGIAPNELENVFSAFVQGKMGIQKEEGTGLGLPISRQYVQMMGGSINLSSQEGYGTLVKLYLPVCIISEEEVPTKSLTRRVVGLAPNQPRYRLLVVDDQWTNRYLLVRLLKSLGFEVKDASNGQEALDIWEQWEPDLIWMDMRMPVMNGYQATKQIRRSIKGQAPSIIALTASSFEEEHVIVLSAGCDDFLRKPFRETDIFEMMSKHLGVRYLYNEPESKFMADNETETDVETKQDSYLISANLALLPTELLNQLEQVTLEADLDMIFTILHDIRLHDAALADELTALADEFEYDEILALLQEVGEVR